MSKTKKKLDKNKFERIFYPIAYVLLVFVFVFSACYAFEKLYYEQIYVSGTSMQPTLMGNGDKGGYSHYGKADKSRRVVNNLKRFDVVITYYPEGWATDGVYIIKRVWGFPGETLDLHTTDTDVTFTVYRGEQEICSYSSPIVSKDDMELGTFNVGSKTFCVNTAGEGKRNDTITLRNDEYFVMGDNWSVSSDSFRHRGADKYVTNSLIQGRVVQIQGIAQIKDGKPVNKQKIRGMFEF